MSAAERIAFQQYLRSTYRSTNLIRPEIDQVDDLVPLEPSPAKRPRKQQREVITTTATTTTATSAS